MSDVYSVSSTTTTTTRKKRGPEDPQPGYDVLFVGLACFVPQEKTRRVLWPDGTRPPATVTPHYAYIAVDPDAIIDKRGWLPADDAQDDLMATGLFRLPKCTIYMTSATDPGTLNAKAHDNRLPSIEQADRTAVVNPNNVNTIAEMTIANGTLEAYLSPGTQITDDMQTIDQAIVSKLNVPYAGQITVTVEERDTQARRTMLLKPGTSVALANLAFPDEGTGVEHFSIYGQLTEDRRLNGRAAPVSAKIPVLQTSHPLFGLGVAINDGSASCGPVSCCSRP
jgi:hypothetical protein